MPDTGAPWNIPYVENADLVRDWPADSLAVANAVAAGLDAAGGLVEVKSALFTGTQSASVASGADLAVTDLSITHETADAANKLIISAFIGQMNDNLDNGRLGMALFDGTNFIAVGDADGNRGRVTVAGNHGSGANNIAMTPAATFVHTPGAGSKTYTVRAINLDETGTRTIFINRTSVTTDTLRNARSASSLVIMEVKV